jgi:hypothetical protein
VATRRRSRQRGRMTRGVRRLWSGKPEAEPDESRPDERALQALAEAVRRAREASGATSPGAPMRKAAPPGPVAGARSAAGSSSDLALQPAAANEDDTSPRRLFGDGDTPELDTSSARPSPSKAAAGASSWVAALHPTRYKVRRRAPRHLLEGVLFAVVIVALLGVLTFTLVSGQHSSSPRPHGRPRATAPSLPAPTSPSSTLPPSTIPTTTRALAPTTTVPATVSTTTPASVVPGSAPQLLSISPSRGATGTVVVVRGKNLLSASGLIVAHFGRHPAPTSCPTPTYCSVTVPPTLSRSSFPLTITTATGTSNALSFLYV